MRKKEFNPHEWHEESARQLKIVKATEDNIASSEKDVESVLKKIESHRKDITSTYDNWLNIGFAFATEFGESGRNLYHRVSKFYHYYSAQECDMKYDSCLKSKGHGVTIKTFFHLAKSAGIDIAPPKADMPDRQHLNSSKLSGIEDHFDPSEPQEPKVVPTFGDFVFAELPEFLQKVVKHAASNEERDILLLGSMTVISACLSNVSGIYDSTQVYSNLYLFISASASTGKGRLNLCRKLVNPIHQELREQSKNDKDQYRFEKVEHKTKKDKDVSEKTNEPLEKMLFIPANNSATGALQLLADNDGKGLIFETEGDTLAFAFKSDYGNYSDGLRKAWHHETISFFRRKDREYVNIEKPCLSVVLSGTPKQIQTLIPTAENGLKSRFVFYFMNSSPKWKNVFAEPVDNGLESYFGELGEEFYRLHNTIKDCGPHQFILTLDQKEQFHQFFELLLQKHMNFDGQGFAASVKRLGLIAFRICMIISALRITKNTHRSGQLICEERDFKATLGMVKVMVKHSSKVFQELPQEETKPQRLNKKEKFLYALPLNFNRQQYLEVAMAMSIPAKTAEGYIAGFVKSALIHHEGYDHYVNTSIEETKDSQKMKEEESSISFISSKS